MIEYIENKALAVYCRIITAIYCFKNEEKGDTNFISIIIILGIVILLAGVFLGFKDTIVQKVQDIVNKIKFE